jgi:metal-responsive CopG/Arc/MetJ family transcriptional regulator
MKLKTSVTLSEKLLKAIEKTAGRGVNRSEFLEQAGWERIALLERRRRETRDRAILDRHAEELNAEALDALEYQIAP